MCSHIIFILKDDRVATVWLNNEEVRKALHALPVSNIGPWELCTLKIEYYADAGSMIPIHRFLIESGYRALIYRFIVIM